MAIATIMLVSTGAVACVSATHASTVGGPMYGGFGATSVGLGGHIWLVAQGEATSAGNIYYKDQSTAASWSGPIGTGTNPCIVGAGTSMDVFWVSTSGALVGRMTTDGTTWKSITLPSTCVDAGTGPAAVYNPITRQVDVFYVGCNNTLMWLSMPANGNTLLQNLGGQVFATPAAATAGTGGIVVVVKGTGGVIYEKTYALGGFGGWTKFHDGLISDGASLVITPATAAATGSRMYLFVAGTTGNLYEAYSTDAGLTWTTIYAATGSGSYASLYWANLGGIAKSAPVAIASGSKLYVGVLGGDGGLWYETGAAPYNATANWFWSATPIAGP